MALYYIVCMYVVHYYFTSYYYDYKYTCIYANTCMYLSYVNMLLHAEGVFVSRYLAKLASEAWVYMLSICPNCHSLVENLT